MTVKTMQMSSGENTVKIVFSQCSVMVVLLNSKEQEKITEMS